MELIMLGIAVVVPMLGITVVVLLLIHIKMLRVAAVLQRQAVVKADEALALQRHANTLLAQLGKLQD